MPCGRLSWLLVRFWAHVNIVVEWMNWMYKISIPQKTFYNVLWGWLSLWSSLNRGILGCCHVCRDSILTVCNTDWLWRYHEHWRHNVIQWRDLYVRSTRFVWVVNRVFGLVAYDVSCVSLSIDLRGIGQYTCTFNKWHAYAGSGSRVQS